MKIVVPMAGRGSRFQKEADKNAEYKKPKPLISVKGRPMITWTLQSLPFVDLPYRPAQTTFTAYPKDLVFISLQEQEDSCGITQLLKDIFGDEIHVILIPEVTRGAVETALQAKELINNDEPLIISDSDHFFDGESLYQTILNKEDDVAGIIPVFRPPDEEAKWSYTLFDDTHIASAVGEKDPILAKKGAHANIGAYYFSSGKLFVDEAEAMLQEGDMHGAAGQLEFYVAPLYNRLIKKGKKVKVAPTPQVWGLGTPKDLELFEKKYR